MGTRNLTIVKADEVTRVAQYCQWDGYPSGQGATVLDFLHKANLEKFKEKVEKLHFLSDREIEQKWKELGADDSGFVSLEISDNFKEKYPHLHRDCGAKVLFKIYNGECDEVKRDEEFLEQGGFFGCEWAYTIDLDENILQVHSDGMKVVATFDLNNLPTYEEFLAKIPNS
jgi:hypothetical protein